MFPKGTKEYELYSQLNSPEKIQTYLESIPFNLEKEGETCRSAQGVIASKEAHCIEAAFFACACRIHAGEKPLIISLKAKKPDLDHIIIPFMRNGYYGALSKTNHPVLRFRDPVYRSVRELVMSYFHEYFLYSNGEKTLVGYTKPINLRRFGKRWLTATEDVWDIAERIYDTPIIPVVSLENRRHIRNATRFEQESLNTKEWK